MVNFLVWLGFFYKMLYGIMMRTTLVSKTRISSFGVSDDVVLPRKYISAI